MRSKYAYRDEWYRDIIDTPSSYYIEPFQIAGNLFCRYERHRFSRDRYMGKADPNRYWLSNMGGHLLHAI